MKKINEYIIEKLKIDKNTQINDYLSYFEIDDYAQDHDLPIWAYKYRKLINGSKNRFWYAIVNYLYKNGPAKKEEIIKFLKPNSNTQYTRLFSELSKCGVLSKGTGSERGFWSLNDCRWWKEFDKNSWIN